MQNQPVINQPQTYTPPIEIQPALAKPKSTLRRFWWIFAIIGVLVLLIILLSILQAQYVNTLIKSGNTQTPVSSPSENTPTTQNPVSSPR